VQINSNTAGEVQIHGATDVTVKGVTLHRETDGERYNSDDAEKTYVDASIGITPQEATNAVGQPHTFTITVKENDGTGASPVQGANPVVSITPTPDGGITDNCAGTGTDASGQCTVVITSSVTGVFTANATVTLTVDGLTVVRSTSDNYGFDGTDSATKTYVDAELTLEPPAATNEVGDTHTFTATLTVNGQPAANELITFTLSGKGSFVGDDFCQTDGSGQCTIDIESSEVGTTTVEAHWNGQVSTVQFSLADSSVKTWVDAQIDLTPLEATNEVGDPHTVTAIVEVHDGSGWAYASDGTVVTFTLPSGGASFVGGVYTCTTSGGQCSVTSTAPPPARWRSTLRLTSR